MATTWAVSSGPLWRLVLDNEDVLSFVETLPLLPWLPVALVTVVAMGTGVRVVGAAESLESLFWRERMNDIMESTSSSSWITNSFSSEGGREITFSYITP